MPLMILLENVRNNQPNLFLTELLRTDIAPLAVVIAALTAAGEEEASNAP